MTDRGWLRAALLLVALDGALYGGLQARPGRLGVVLWQIGPPLVLGLAIALLAAGLVTALRARHRGSRARLGGLAALGLVVASMPLYTVYPSSYDDAPSAVRFRLPLDGLVTVAWGGRERETNYHVVDPAQRWAYDLLVAENGISYRGEGATVEDYLGYGLPVLAPAAGIVREVVDGEPDTPIGTGWRGANPAGNHVVLEVAPGQFLFVAHLRPRSLRVRRGDRVRAGQPIGAVGNSGNSSEPHVHLHLQDTPGELGEAIPFYFFDYEVDGRRVERGMPTGGRRAGRWTGEIVRNADPLRSAAGADAGTRRSLLVATTSPSGDASSLPALAATSSATTPPGGAVQRRRQAIAPAVAGTLPFAECWM
ncbi:MAG TPA: M23 family metallopeptidase [Vicinamibacterales bacterium]|nr:M23 family metallopeptidase [Vicinamibacterales bacterium]